MIKLGIVMDPISSINIKKDSSFAMLLAAQARNWQLYYMEMDDLYLDNNIAKATTSRLVVQEHPTKWFSLSDPQEINLSDLDVILMRKDPPFNIEYIYVTYILEYAERLGTLIVNKPQSLRDCNEKLFTLWFPDLIAETLVTRNKHLISRFLQKHKDIILKPLDGMGGISIFRLTERDPNFSAIIEMITQYGQQYCMAQVFLPEITQGDKRILIVDGEVVPYCLARIAKPGETRANLAAGGRGEPQPLNATELALAQTIAPVLKEKGLIFVGLDVIGSKVTEINVTSPTCIKEIESAYPVSISDMLMDAIEKRLNTKCKNK